LGEGSRDLTPTDHADAARVVDANLNRGRESLRVLDDYARFVLNDPFLTERLKSLRHRLAALADRLPPSLLAARDTPGDVGTAVTAAGEYRRESPREVAAVNFKRLQESLRSVEEFGKVFGPDVGREAEAIRYEAYTLERATILGATARERLARARLYVLLSGSGCVLPLERTIAEAAAGGADVIQLREKGLPDRELIERARQVRTWTRAAGVLFVVNDRPDVARLADADGVHLGQDDLSVRDARRVLGPDSLIGVSTHSVEQVRRAVLDGADYIGVGPTFPSGTKAFDALAGTGFVTAAAQETALPAFVLGGIDARTIAAAVAAGAKRVAVSGAIARSGDPRAAAAELRAALPPDVV
jgi:thiamine-phosphate pyrophosphorylase